ncbi:hypothetical protein [Streptomyces sp. NPDC058985]|uniref:hypothetical protein n=1 Tax=Streptomyces sp. NPDC058985 TaxID=3346684 RepID=UPI0036978ABA
MAASVSRSAIRFLTGSGSYGDWFTNCLQGLHVPVRQTLGHRLDRLPRALEHQAAP